MEPTQTNNLEEHKIVVENYQNKCEEILKNEK